MNRVLKTLLVDMRFLLHLLRQLSAKTVKRLGGTAMGSNSPIYKKKKTKPNENRKRNFLTRGSVDPYKD